MRSARGSLAGTSRDAGSRSARTLDVRSTLRRRSRHRAIDPRRQVLGSVVGDPVIDRNPIAKTVLSAVAVENHPLEWIPAMRAGASVLVTALLDVNPQ